MVFGGASGLVLAAACAPLLHNTPHLYVEDSFETALKRLLTPPTPPPSGGGVGGGVGRGEPSRLQMSSLDSPPLAGRRLHVPALVVREEPDARTSGGGCAGACETNLPAATADSCVDQTQPFLSGKIFFKKIACGEAQAPEGGAALPWSPASHFPQFLIRNLCVLELKFPTGTKKVWGE